MLRFDGPGLLMYVTLHALYAIVVPQKSGPNPQLPDSEQQPWAQICVAEQVEPC